MRFTADGPSIPGELLEARDEGGVIFFCGSGVSRARSRLPDFYELANNVVRRLGASKRSPAREVITASERAGRIPGVGGLVPADRVFSLLEREFDTEHVRTAVAEELKPRVDDLSAHRILLDLSRGRDGEVRLVTTNFDPLFELAEPDVPIRSAPDLPDPSRPSQFRGIVHLHGRVDKAFRPVQHEEFVLSSADFGRAYLAHGWATRFIRELLDHYHLVFIGYAADDPPVQYLLEAIGSARTSPRRIFAFQDGEPMDAAAIWSQRGVEAIPFNPENGFRHLWETLDAWAARARDPERWTNATLTRAQMGPAASAPHERGQVAHIAATATGAKAIARLDPPLPGEWLCAFDPAIRYGQAGNVGYDEEGAFIDPFLLWGLDGDEPPPPFDITKRRVSREMPPDAWSAFTATTRDRIELGGKTLPGFFSQHAHPLPSRLDHLGTWLTRVAHEPAAMWWAAGKHSVHPAVAVRIQRELARHPELAMQREVWRHLAREGVPDPSAWIEGGFYQLEDEIKLDGWTSERVTRLAALRRPFPQVRRPIASLQPPTTADSPHEILSFDLRYPNAAVPTAVPDEHLPTYLRHLTRTVEDACSLIETFGGCYYGLAPFHAEELEGNEANRDTGHDVTALYLHWIGQLGELARIDREAVRAILLPLAGREELPLAGALVWAASRAEISDGPKTAKLLASLPDTAFWSSDLQRDLLHCLLNRWNEMPPAGRLPIEHRLIAGRPLSREEDDREEWAAWHALDRLEWLRSRGLAFQVDVEAEIARLRAVQPNWEPARAETADSSNEIRVRRVRQDDDPSALDGVPLTDLIPRSRELSRERFEALVRQAPFQGLVRSRPVRTLAALRRLAPGDAEWEWSAFLVEDRKTDTPRLARLVALVLLGFTPDELAPIVSPASRWLEIAWASLATSDPKLPWAVCDTIATALRSHPERGRSAIQIIGRTDREWAMRALNSPSGRLAALILRKSQPPGNEALGPSTLKRLDSLLSIPGDAAMFAFTALSRELGYLHHRAPRWTEERVMRRRLEGEDESEAFWAGAFRSKGWSSAIHRILNPELVELAGRRSSDRDWYTGVSLLLLRGWIKDDLRKDGAALANEDLREALIEAPEELRVAILRLAQRSMHDPEGPWGVRAVELIGKAWPRQRSVRTANVSQALVSFVLGGKEHFPLLVAAAHDVIVPVDEITRFHINMTNAGAHAYEHPEAMLQLLMRILPEDASLWPPRLEPIIATIADGVFGHDERVAELKRRLAAR